MTKWARQFENNLIESKFKNRKHPQIIHNFDQSDLQFGELRWKKMMKTWNVRFFSRAKTTWTNFVVNHKHFCSPHMLTCEGSKNTIISNRHRLTAVHVDQQHCTKSSHRNGAWNKLTQNKAKWILPTRTKPKKMAGVPS